MVPLVHVLEGMHSSSISGVSYWWSLDGCYHRWYWMFEDRDSLHDILSTCTGARMQVVVYLYTYSAGGMYAIAKGVPLHYIGVSYSLWSGSSW